VAVGPSTKVVSGILEVAHYIRLQWVQVAFLYLSFPNIHLLNITLVCSSTANAAEALPELPMQACRYRARLTSPGLRAAPALQRNEQELTCQYRAHLHRYLGSYQGYIASGRHAGKRCSE
jgi:hypothetical protein